MRAMLALCFLVLLASEAVADEVARGHDLLAKNCSRCHAIGQTGKSTHKQAPPFREVMKIYGADSLTEALAEGLVTGHPDMPEFKFTANDAAAIVSYLHSLEAAP